MSRFPPVLLAAAVGCAGAAPGWADEAADGPKVKVEIRKAETRKADGLTAATVAGTTTKVYLHKTAELTAADIAGATLSLDGDKNPRIELTLTRAGGRKMADLSKDRANKPLAILVDGTVIAAPVVKAVVTDRVMVTGKFSREEAEKLVAAVRGK
jgi:preprotein translocase subunit SecD